MERQNSAKSQGVVVNIGAAIRLKLKERKHSVVWFAEKLECSRTNVYKIFAKNSISTGELLKISEILGFDFFKLFSERLKDAGK